MHEAAISTMGTDSQCNQFEKTNTVKRKHSMRLDLKFIFKFYKYPISVCQTISALSLSSYHHSILPLAFYNEGVNIIRWGWRENRGEGNILYY